MAAQTQKKVVGIIPARGGSVGVPLKNIKPLAGKPLIAYTIESAKKAKLLDKEVWIYERNPRAC